jgi:NTE family protein
MAETSKKRFDAEVATLEESGSKVTVIAPDAGSVEAFGVNLMDFTRRAGAAEAGLAQGRAAAAGITW